MAQLPEPWILNGVNVEALIRHRLNKIPTFLALSHQDQEDGVSAMFEVVVKIANAYDPTKASFSRYLHHTIGLRWINHMRDNIHDPRSKTPKPTFVEWSDDLDEWSLDQDDYGTDEHDLLADIDVDQLTESAKDCLYRFAIPLWRGIDIETLAEARQVKPAWIRSNLESLRQEIALADNA